MSSLAAVSVGHDAGTLTVYVVDADDAGAGELERTFAALLERKRPGTRWHVERVEPGVTVEAAAR